MLDKIINIGNNAGRIVVGTFRGQGAGADRGEVDFRSKGDDVVMTKRDGTFISMMKEGINNTSVQNTLKGE